ncbi:acetyl esterase/lipase [Litorivivens lipolytica]|uniref:Acetyl esterase/lipase n=1 Tax=Litorivivens lipolytica TaxID=1524264 RepID=A0A7W4W3Y9_9GAMM|nr:alpha/beta hydrolase [Litorivivens lipolytica]MBB3046905.1 acetyl esterase/lipase [Litorivivens lipolytica]
MTLSENYQQLRAALTPGLANPDDSLEEVRQKMHAIHPTEIPDDATVETLHDYPVSTVSVQTPAVTNRDSAVMMVHGGAFVSTQIPHYIPYATALSRYFKRQVIIFDYRLAPEHPFPAALDDSEAVYRSLLETFTPSRLAIIGDSCGGGIALSLLCRLRDSDLPLPAAYAGLSPWLDLEMTGDAAMQDRGEDPFVCAPWIRQRGLDYAGSAEPGDPRLSPLHADFSGLPPLFFATGSEDITRDDSRRAHRKALSHGVHSELDLAPHMIHGYHGLSALAPECSVGCERIAAFIDHWLE